MRPRLVPSAAEELRSIAYALDEVIKPSLSGGSELSTLATMQHLLRHVELRIAQEGQVLLDEVNYLGKLLPEAIDWLVSAQPNGDLSLAIRRDLERETPAEVYPSLTIMADKVAALRAHVSSLLVLLHASTEDDDARRALHSKLRDYVRWQIEREADLIEPAFRNMGPRR